MIPGKRTIGYANGERFTRVTVSPTRLVHYSPVPIGELRVRERDDNPYKPTGLWVSDEACPDSWSAYCKAGGYLDLLTYAYDVDLKADANILWLRSAADIDAFTDRWAAPAPIPTTIRMWIDWPGLRRVHDGLIITPYVRERRLSMLSGRPDTMWYYTWDCASGCIWNPDAVAAIRPRAQDAIRRRPMPRTKAPRHESR